MAEDGKTHYITANELAVPSSAHEVRLSSSCEKEHVKHIFGGHHI